MVTTDLKAHCTNTYQYRAWTN